MFAPEVLNFLQSCFISCPCLYVYLLFLQVAVSLLTVHLIGKLETTNAGCLSVSLLQKIHLVSKEV